MGFASSVRRREVVSGERVDGIQDSKDWVCDEVEDFLVLGTEGRDGGVGAEDTRCPDGRRAY